MKIIGHRGARGHAPENTLLSIQEAIALGVDMVEFDVYALPSGEVVIIHDHRVDRTTNALGRVMDFDFATLRSLNAGRKQQVPTLQEALQLVNGRCEVNIELKGPGTAAAVATILPEYIAHVPWRLEHFLVSSFDHHELKTFKTLMPTVAIAALEHTVPLNYAAAAAALQAIAVNPNHEFLTQAFVDDAHARGLKVYAYTVNEPDDVHDLLEMGVDGVTTDYPDRVRAAIKQYQTAAPLGVA